MLELRARSRDVTQLRARIETILTRMEGSQQGENQLMKDYKSVKSSLDQLRHETDSQIKQIERRENNIQQIQAETDMPMKEDFNFDRDPWLEKMVSSKMDFDGFPPIEG